VPPGGTSTCTSGATSVSCKGWDASGALCCATGCNCPTTGGFTVCWQLVGSTCC
jgi:hypothetical protein